MGSLIGHVLPGLGFFLIGLWQLVNHIKLHARHPKSYTSVPFFPIKKSRYGELYFMMIGSTISILMELFVGPVKHHPFDTDGTIPTTHLHNFEHASISLTILTYAVFAKILDRFGRPNSKYGMTLALGVLAFWQEYILFHLHSTDHMGLEGHYHWFLQILILVSLITTVLGIPYPKSFMVSFVRSFSIVFQGVWYNVMGIMLWTKALMPKGCFMHLEEAHYVVWCNTQEALDRAKALTTLEFSWYLVICIVLTMCLYLYMIKVYPEQDEHEASANFLSDDHQEEKELVDSEAQKKSRNFGLLDVFISKIYKGSKA
ncbi:transmembrane protein 45B-like [Impatiens glandulifera]|uniref:transmembrane protein 45B-like n=1 Tax=Impatiens glandulifera TaxID=253017 RepID=UPI001FB0F923|nr:transmembrane protein 45B-like [Impatiens glandulifera]